MHLRCRIRAIAVWLMRRVEWCVIGRGAVWDAIV